MRVCLCVCVFTCDVVLHWSDLWVLFAMAFCTGTVDYDCCVGCLEYVVVAIRGAGLTVFCVLACGCMSHVICCVVCSASVYVI